MKTLVSALLGLAATLVVGASAFAAPVESAGPMVIADIGRDSMELSQIHEGLPTVSDLFVDFPEIQKSQGFTGTTTVAVILDDKNKLVRTSILQSCGNKFVDTQAMYGVQRASFRSGTIAGKSVGGEYSIRVNFGNDR